MHKTKVTVVMSWYAPYRLPLFRRLAKTAGVDLLTVFCSDREFGPIDKLEQPFRYRFLQSKTLFNYRFRNIFGDRNTIRFPWGLFSALRKESPDVVVGYEFRVDSMVAALYCLLHGCPYVTWSDTTGPQEERFGPVRRMVRRLLLWRSGALIGSSTDTLDFFRSIYRFPTERSFLSILSAHLESFMAGQDAAVRRAEDGLVRFIYVGQLIRRKGVDILLHAFALLRKKVPEARLTLVGKGEEREPLEQMCASLGCGECVEFKNFIPNNLLAGEFLRHDVFVFPTRLDVFGLVVAEAVACGLPVICTDRAGAARDLVKGNGLVVKHDDIGMLLKAMEKLAVDPELRRKMSFATRSVLSRHNLAAAAAGFMSAIGLAMAAPEGVETRDEAEG